ncbi:hypothetical protein J2X56_001130 [Herbaspirillum sp. 1173]|uniref:hypothetical protein n=1 Tax=Herbaspirillum sp. 1173 TaxID=2817734 RepID=UPI002859EF23|nr:hypothetical protein [Herbaspirillum sp. 1173]MDR6739144.1 hypothetical protein [Herbaspirillum sp. 1173]
MKKILTTAALSLVNALPAHAGNVGQCVFPKTTIQKNGNLQFKKPIAVYSAPDLKSNQSTLTALTAFSVAKESNGLAQLVEVPGFDGSNPRAGKAIGWVKLSDFDFQELRNCN